MGKIKSILDSGSGGVIIDVECHLANSLPGIVIVGFANKSVDEAKERIRGALAASNIKIPKKRITVNLAPADIPKEGSVFDLPILTAILVAGGIVSKTPSDNAIILGEVSLDGSIRAIRGVIGKILSAKKLGITEFWIPEGNLKQASLITDIKIRPVKDIKHLYSLLNSPEIQFIQSTNTINPVRSKETLTLDDVVGQEQAKRALLIAAAGQHNIMLNGPPGTGKSMLAKALPSILPNLTQQEMLEVTHLYSLSNKNFDVIVTERPFRSPHHSSSHTSIIGGGTNPKPGEITLSHNGVLFFDEFPEFTRSVLESLRQPLEDQKISIARAKETVDFPAHFIFVATSNPCPCGYFGSKKECSCLPTQIINYQRKISGPILDRIDLYVEVEEIENSKIMSSPDGKTHEKMRIKVQNARELQKNRLDKLNSQLSNRDLRKISNISEPAQQLLDSAAERMRLSARSYIRSLRVARTIADIEDSQTIEPEHISEALQYRKRALDY